MSRPKSQHERQTFSLYARRDFVQAFQELESDRVRNPDRLKRPQMLEAVMSAILSGKLLFDAATGAVKCECCGTLMEGAPSGPTTPITTSRRVYEAPPPVRPLTIPLLGGAATQAPLPPAAPVTPAPQAPHVLSAPAPTVYFEGETPAQINRRRYDFMIHLLTVLANRPDIAARLPPEILNNPACSLLLPQGNAGQWDPNGPVGPNLIERAARGYANGAFNQFLAERLPNLLALPEALPEGTPSDFTS